MSGGKIITLEVDGVEKYFLNIQYTKNHPTEDPDTFELHLTPDEATGIDFFDQVVIKKDGVTEFVGFIEEITPEVGEDGLEYTFTGRCWKLILWKKYTDKYQESREVGPEISSDQNESGFFGEVYPSELIKFILRCPISDHPRGKIRQKIGWGICSDYWVCCANETADCFYPQWVALRYTGLAWRGRGTMISSTSITLNIPSVGGFDNTYREWQENGASPWLDLDDGFDNFTRPWNGNSVVKKQGYWSFNDVPVVSPPYTIVLDVTLHIKLYVSESLGSDDNIYPSIFDGSAWHDLEKFSHDFHFGWGTDWGEQTWEISKWLKTVDMINSAKLLLTADKGWKSVWDITYAYLTVVVSKQDLSLGTQQANDWFVIDLHNSYDRVTGIYYECRLNPTFYARNYKIQWSEASNVCENNYGANDSEWNDFTPNVLVQNNTARDILHSWEPEDGVRAIRIKLTTSADQPWEISQAYVWQSDVAQFRVMDE